MHFASPLWAKASHQNLARQLDEGSLTQSSYLSSPGTVPGAARTTLYLRTEQSPRASNTKGAVCELGGPELTGR